MANLNLQVALETVTAIVGLGSDVVNALIAKHLTYGTQAAQIDANGTPFAFKMQSTDRIWSPMDKALVEATIHSLMLEQGEHDDEGRLRMNAPLVVPFHVDGDGTPITQLRLFYYRKRYADGEQPTPVQTMFRIEPYGTVSQYEARVRERAEQEAVAEGAPVAQ
jgi:hypothetical protein